MAPGQLSSTYHQMQCSLLSVFFVGARLSEQIEDQIFRRAEAEAQRDEAAGHLSKTSSNGTVDEQPPADLQDEMAWTREKMRLLQESVVTFTRNEFHDLTITGATPAPVAPAAAKPARFRKPGDPVITKVTSSEESSCRYSQFSSYSALPLPYRLSLCLCLAPAVPVCPILPNPPSGTITAMSASSSTADTKIDAEA
ncbi:hypothetical protein FQN49_001825 [Arthroderma sp. PD_2]|nr:hypothetical protein FQN49_001825 [Arthroderma sp. PD_2]